MLPGETSSAVVRADTSTLAPGVYTTNLRLISNGVYTCAELAVAAVVVLLHDAGPLFV